jgi:hypothetical protein
MRQFGFAAIVIGLVAVSATGQDAVTIKSVRPKAGDRIKTTISEKETTTTSFTIGGKAEKKSVDSTKSILYVTEIVAGGTGDEPPVKLLRTYEKYDLSKGPKPGMAAPPLKTPILIEKKDGKYTYTVDGKPVEKGVAALLDAEFAKTKSDFKGEDFLPKGPVKPGDTWKPDIAKFAKALAEEKLVPDVEKSSIVCKLVSSSKKNGNVYGVVELKMDIAIKGLEGQPDITVKSGLMSMTMTGNICLDGTDPTEDSKDLMNFKIEAETKGITFVVEGKGEKTETKELLPKK